MSKNTTSVIKIIIEIDKYNDKFDSKKPENNVSETILFEGSYEEAERYWIKFIHNHIKPYSVYMTDAGNKVIYSNGVEFRWIKTQKKEMIKTIK